MPSRTISLLLADADGAQVTPGETLTERARDAARGLHRASIRFAITSGRPPRGMAMLVDPLAIDTPIAAFNGGTFVRPDLSLIEERELASDVAKQAMDIILNHGLEAWVHSGDDWRVRNA